MADSVSNPHFLTVGSLKEAAAELAFQPIEPGHTAGQARLSIQIHVRDHKNRELRVADRTLEIHYGAFVFSQARRGIAEAARLALSVSYGRAPRAVETSGHPAHVHELGPKPGPADIDGREPAVVTWHDGEMHYLVASGELPAEVLVRIAGSLYR
ncbi:hypothetical protein ACFLRH_01980 [Actinomycetota bacterium]